MIAEHKSQSKLSERISLRVPRAIRDKARALAQAETTDSVRVFEGDVYRHIITLFFSGECLQNVDDSKDRLQTNGGDKGK